MVRGRKKDLTTPPSHALTQQRDYRARKAQYLCELQQRCARAEEENARLRRELEIARAASNVPSNIYSAEVTLASRDLMQHLTNLSASISRFQRVAQPWTLSPLPSEPSLYVLHSDPHHSTSVSRQPQSSTSTLHRLHPAVLPSPPSPASLLSKLPPINPTLVRPETHVLPPPQSSDHHRRLRDSQPDATSTPTPDTCPSPSPSLGSDCCGGYIDCTGLVEEEAREECACTSSASPRSPQRC
ncbi:hypothetical protein PAXRUDRAFT_825012 [Paxillus rubicundulus Ve08.2h10]|uniref:BZIP domain-containing protein n=1 Tax=Paxillus rubicundulus Ve08.2h10 TaxID=930991 RepID=A0A0D0DH23_9AGAM|nr:hypothetical protein PAXRUDRAFT_825012 [Paxillus rubicundulus Ve08.2h10]